MVQLILSGEKNIIYFSHCHLSYLLAEKIHLARIVIPDVPCIVFLL